MATTDSRTSEDFAFLDNGGSLSETVLKVDWPSTALGPIAGWQKSQRAIISFALRSPLAIATMWGKDGVMIYNDAYALVAGDKHPASLGMRVREVWPEAADFNGMVLDTVLAGQSLSYIDQEFTLVRNGVAQQTWFNLDYSPIIGDDGTPIGVIGSWLKPPPR